MNFELCFYTFSTYFYIQNSCVQNCFVTFLISFFSSSICFLQRAEDWRQCEVWTLILNSDTVYLWYGHISSDDILLICSSGFSYFEHWSPSSDCSFFLFLSFSFSEKWEEVGVREATWTLNSVFIPFLCTFNFRIHVFRNISTAYFVTFLTLNSDLYRLTTLILLIFSFFVQKNERR